MGRFFKRTNQNNNEIATLFMGRFNVTNKLKQSKNNFLQIQQIQSGKYFLDKGKFILWCNFYNKILP
jgi:hypothetical protein